MPCHKKRDNYILDFATEYIVVLVTKGEFIAIQSISFTDISCATLVQ